MNGLDPETLTDQELLDLLLRVARHALREVLDESRHRHEEIAAMSALRKRTVFEPCNHHQAMYATETRRRCAEVMVGAGWSGSPCPGERCRMKPGTDFFEVSFVADNPVYQVEQWPVDHEHGRGEELAS